MLFLKMKELDVESQKVIAPSIHTDTMIFHYTFQNTMQDEVIHENAKVSTSVQSGAFWLTAWFANNLFITIMNKAVFSKLDFPYPYSLTAVHMACNSIGAMIFLTASSSVNQKQLSPDQKKTMFWFSLLFAGNIAMGNLSLRHVSVAFNQVTQVLFPAAPKSPLT